MKTSYFKSMTFILIPFLFILGHSAHGQSPTAGTATVEVDLARFVAGQYVHRYYPEFEWRNLDHMVLYDIDGAVRAYAMVFAKADSPFHSSADLQRHIREKSVQLLQAKEKAATSNSEAQAEGETAASVVETEEELYNFDNLATVITGATSDSKLILRHFRGLPRFWVNAETLDADTSVGLYGSPLKVSHVIMITPMDFRLSASEGTKDALTASDVHKAEKATIPESAQILNVTAKSAEKMSAVRKARRSMEARKQQRLNTLEPAKRAKYEKALRNRAKFLADRWQKYREMRAIQKTREGVAK